MKLRNYRLMTQGSPQEFHNKQTIQLESSSLQRALLLQTAPNRKKSGHNYPINTRPIILGKVRTP